LRVYCRVCCADDSNAIMLCRCARGGIGDRAVRVLFLCFWLSVGDDFRHGISLLRQLVFGFSTTVLMLYLIYFNLLALLFGFLGKYISLRVKCVPLLTVIACVCTIGFTMLDNVLTPWWLGYSGKLFKMYFWASFSFMIPQVICTAVSVGVLFYPLAKFFKKL